MWIYDLETLAFLDVNESAVRRYGYSRDEFLRMKLTDIRPAEDVGRLLADVQQDRPALESSGGWRHLTKTGELMNVEITSHTLEFAGRPAVLVVVHDITERRQTQQQLAQHMAQMERRAIEFAALLDTAKDLAGQRDVRMLLRLIVERAVALMSCTGGYMYLYDPARHDLELVVVQDVPVQLGTRLSLGEGLTGLVAQTRQPKAVDRYQEWEHRAQRFAGISITSLAAVPMEFGGELVGVLGVAELDHETRAFTDDHVRLLALLAAHAAAAVHAARSLEQTQRRLHRVGALHTIDVAITGSVDLSVTLRVFLDQLTSQLGVDAACVLLLNRRGQTLEYAVGRGFRNESRMARASLRLGQGYPGRAAVERRTVNIPHLAPDDPGRPSLSGEAMVAYYVTPLVSKGDVRGVLEVFHRTELHVDSEWLEFFEVLAGQAAIAVDNASLFTDLSRSNVELSLAYDTTLEGWSRALDLRDKETEGHTLRVTEVAVQLARAFGVSEDEITHIRRGALLHDIGKMGIPDSILHKPGPLTEEEWSVMRRHPVHAYELLLPIGYLKPALDIPYCHHERWDGKGYPRGLAGEQIPLAARIFTVVDVWDALRSARPYRPAWPEDKVRAYLQERAGVEFDPRVVDVFVDLDVAAS